MTSELFDFVSLKEIIVDETKFKDYLKTNHEIVFEEIIEDNTKIKQLISGIKHHIKVKLLLRDLGKSKTENEEIEMLKPYYEAQRNCLILNIYPRGVSKKITEEFETLIKHIDPNYFKINLNKKSYIVVETE